MTDYILLFVVNFLVLFFVFSVQFSKHYKDETSKKDISKRITLFALVSSLALIGGVYLIDNPDILIYVGLFAGLILFEINIFAPIVFGNRFKSVSNKMLTLPIIIPKLIVLLIVFLVL